MNTARTCARAISVFIVGLAGVATAQPVLFTGDAEADFGPGAVIIQDPGQIDVGVPLAFPPGTISGNDIKDLRLSYDEVADVMYVGFNMYRIATDVDSQAGPDVTGPALAGLGGIDIARVGGTEAFALLVDIDQDDTIDLIVGVSGTTDIDGFAAAAFNGSPFAPGFAFGAPLAPHTGAVVGTPSALLPDLEFTVPNWSALPTSTGGDLSAEFSITAFVGSFSDAGIGEDFTPGADQFAPVCFPQPEICNDFDDDCDGDIDEGFQAGVICNVGVGNCAAIGVQVCLADGTIQCSATPSAPLPEACNAIDDDCDGETDEGIGGGQCTGTLPGVCAVGHVTCEAGQVACVPVTPPGQETCDNADNDCDGTTDEGFVVGQMCQVGVGACRIGGVTLCAEDGGIRCSGTPGSPNPETCDAIDNDCDGQSDEGYNLGDACSAGAGACETNGVIACDGDGGSACAATPGDPVGETCNGFDDDCDGSVDEGTGGDACNTGVAGVCSTGTDACVNGALVCQGESQAGAEVCDSLDNDCDGQSDEGFGVGAACQVGVGACMTNGVVTCGGDGAATCSGTQSDPVPETCDAIDNDCDGQADEGLGLGDACNVGVGACAANGESICDGNGGVTCNAQPGQGGAEVCNNADDDCDGQIDEGLGLGAVCSAGVGACQTSGITVCGDGAVVCDAQPRQPAAEVCDNTDNDCDGQLDEGLGLGELCETGVGECNASGVNICDGVGGVTCNATSALPKADDCNGLDDDCDGSTDEKYGIGEACSAGVGACAVDGEVACDGNGGSACAAQAGDPVAEVCDGGDNDCDGDIDEGIVGDVCQSGQPGVCGPGSTVCINGATVCEPGNQPGAEVCDRADNDCDGSIDETFGIGELCNEGVGACASDGVTICDTQGGAKCSATQGDPQPETCNAVDDDCDGDIDEGIVRDVCQSGEPGACGPGSTVCINGATVCEPGNQPGAEVCDRADNDCDGSIDETFGIGELCNEGVGACASDGVTICDTQGGAKCSATQGDPQPEACNAVDDDCDGDIDEGIVGDVCQSGQPGVCGPGSTVCVNGATVCEPGNQPGVEICDTADNDCDGNIDEGTGAGEACQLGVGACMGNGVNVCAANGAVECSATQGDPQPETCNAADDDCDGDIDEGIGGDACQSGEPGACGPGTTVCVNGALSCEPGVQPGVETCNGADDDCDATTDEGIGGDACQSGQPGACGPGTTACVNGALSCEPGLEPGVETCNAVDDDCDGSIDEGFNVGGDCEAGVGACNGGGIIECDGNGGVTCTGNPYPAGDEVCNGIDDDCDGRTDEGLGLGDACTAGIGACAADGERVCGRNGAVVCDAAPGAPVDETCDGLDTDCDGTIDEDTDGAACDSGLLGACGPGTTACVAGLLECDPANEPGAETCDALDNDCDGSTDEGFGLGDGCDEGQGACADAGTVVCDGEGGATCDAEPGQPGAETCNAVDDDCDGSIDEGFNVGDACQNGHGACAGPGQIICRDGAAVCDADGGDPQMEICDGVDNDCDGDIDESSPARQFAANEYAANGHAVWLPNFYGDGARTRLHFNDDAVFTMRHDGTASITGNATVHDGGVPGEVWYVDVDLAMRGRGPDFGGPKIERAAAQPAAITDQWVYYDIVAGAVSRGDLIADLTQRPVDGSFPLQFGERANGKNNALGASVWFDWVLFIRGERVRSGHGDINVNLDPMPVCPEICDGEAGAQPETCNNTDDDCDGIVDEGFGTGAACIVGQGECAAEGEQACGMNGDVVCEAMPGAPQDETCDSLDNDCDGTTDEGLGLGDACNAGEGACAVDGEQVCDGDGAVTCDAEPGAPQAEICDAADNDCDGNSDEGLGLGERCEAGEGACAADGETVCGDGGGVVCDAEPGQPADETCDALDNDCDAASDEGLGLGMPCTAGVGACAADGESICDGNGGVTCSADAVEAGVETCDGLDNDCDGVIDEGFGLGDACNAGQGACAAVGTVICDGNGGATCDADPAQPGAELCDDMDNDCDGFTDEGFGVGERCAAGQGACRTIGERVCDANGGVVCDAEAGAPIDELCDEADNDCDGLIDEDFDLDGECSVGLGECRRDGQRICGEDEVVAGLGGNLVLNGSFENPQLDRDWAVFQDIQGWTTISGNGIEIQRINDAATGEQYVELDSHPTPGGGCMMQQIPVDIGGIYRLSISHSARPNVADNRVALYWDGVEVAELDADGRGLNNTQWTRYGYDVTGNSNSGTLVLCDVTNDRDTLGGFVDSITIEMVEGIMCDVDPGEPVDERCDALDNDCDGYIDEDLGIGDECQVGVGACANVGARQCDEGGDVICAGRAGEPVDEACDAVDNDCDGLVDEGACAQQPPCEGEAPGTRVYQVSAWDAEQYALYLPNWNAQGHRTDMLLRDGATFTVRPDGTAALTGTAFVNNLGGGAGQLNEEWAVDMQFELRGTGAAHGGPYRERPAVQPVEVTDLWTYYNLTAGTFTRGEVVATLAQYPENGRFPLQVGQWANGRSDTFGASNWYRWTRNNADGSASSGIGDMNISLDELCVSPEPEACSECDGKVTRMTLRNRGPAGRVVVEQRREGVIFDQQVAEGAAFELVGVDRRDTLGTEVNISVDGGDAVRIHTSCSVPIGPGAVFGDFIVVEAYSRNGGLICGEPDDCEPQAEVCNQADDDPNVEPPLCDAGEAYAVDEYAANGHAIVMPNFDGDGRGVRMHLNDDALFRVVGDSGHLTGTAVRTDNGDVYTVDVRFTLRGQGPEFGGPKIERAQWQSADVTDLWRYFDMAEATLMHDGLDVVTLTQMPADGRYPLQVGMTANGKTQGLGMASWFFWVRETPEGRSNGTGDINVNLDDICD